MGPRCTSTCTCSAYTLVYVQRRTSSYWAELTIIVTPLRNARLPMLQEGQRTAVQALCVSPPQSAMAAKPTPYEIKRMPVPMREEGSIAPMSNPMFKGDPPYSGAWADAGYDPETPGWIYHPGACSLTRCLGACGEFSLVCSPIPTPHFYRACLCPRPSIPQTKSACHRQLTR